jgi:DNA-binding NarL/FixJ family response regulator
MTRIYIVDDHTLVANTIADLINGIQGFEVAAQLKHGKELLDHFETISKLPDIILLDINMPILNGFDTMLALNEHYPDIRVLALSMNDDDDSIIKMMKAGACGYLSKQIRQEELLLALNMVNEKGFYYTDQVLKLVMNNFKSKSVESVQLTEREKELLSYIGSEMTYKEIAEKMFISPKTVDGYREDLFHKLEIKSRVGLAVYAIKHGYYELKP